MVGIAISRDVKIGMAHAIDNDVVFALGVDGGRCKNVENCCGARLQLRKIRLFFAKDHALQKRLVNLIFFCHRSFFLPARGDRCNLFPFWYLLTFQAKVTSFSFLEITVKMRIIKVDCIYAYYREEKTYDLYH